MIQLDPSVREVLDGYVEILTSLEAKYRWKSSTNVLRLAALTVTGMPPEQAVEGLDRAAETLKRSGAWWGPLSTPLRFVLGGLLARREINVEQVAAGLSATLDGFKEQKLARGGYSAAIAAFLLVMGRGGDAADPVLIARLSGILASWKKDHPWITGQGDMPLAAIHALRDEPVEYLAKRVESIYQALDEAGLKKGDQLQLAAQLLALAPWTAEEAAQAMVRMAESARAHKVRPRRGLYDEAALLALSGGDPDELAHGVATLRQALMRWRVGRKKLFGALTIGEEEVLSIATGLLLLSRVNELERLQQGADAAALIAAKAALEAQQAAAIAAASTIAVAATSS